MIRLCLAIILFASVINVYGAIEFDSTEFESNGEQRDAMEILDLPSFQVEPSSIFQFDYCQRVMSKLCISEILMTETERDALKKIKSILCDLLSSNEGENLITKYNRNRRFFSLQVGSKSRNPEKEGQTRPGFKYGRK